jgi:hypothetical protein
MLFLNKLFKPAPLLEEEAQLWLLHTFAWCLRHFDADFFYRESVLVLPSNRYFPGRADTPQAMAELILKRVQAYAGMSHWPCAAIPVGSCGVDAPLVQISGSLRGVDLPPLPAPPHLLIQYDPRQINNPEALIAVCAHSLAHYLSAAAPQDPPGTPEYRPYATEVLAIFMGFGLMFANSAFHFQGGCGSCATVGRSAYLSEYESTYALALFCVLKKIPASDVSRHLKKHLRGFFKRALKEISLSTIPELSPLTIPAISTAL